MVCLSKVSPKATVKKQMTSPRPYCSDENNIHLDYS